MNGLLRSSIYSWRQNKPTAGYEAAGENAKAARAAAEHRFIVNCAPVSLKRSHKNGGCAAGSSRASGRESLLSDWLHGEKLARRLVSATGLASFTGLHSWRPRQPARSDYPHSQQDKLYSRSSPQKTGCTAGTLPGTQPSKYSLPLAKIARRGTRCGSNVAECRLRRGSHAPTLTPRQETLLPSSTSTASQPPAAPQTAPELARQQ